MKTNEKLTKKTSTLPFNDLSNKLLQTSIDETILLNNFVYQEYFQTAQKGKNIHFFTNECFYLVYCWNGGVVFFNNGKQKRIRPQESCIIYDSKGSGIFLDFLTNATTRFSVICFNRPQITQIVRESTCFFKFKQVFKEYASGRETYYIGKSNLEIVDKINSLTRIPNSNVANEFILEGMLFHIFGLKMIQMMEENQMEINKFGGFSCWEIEQLQSISQYISSNPGKEYTVEYLCRKTGLGPNKLQKGFKKMHNRTIIDYIRNIRLEHALHLINTTNMSITEIVYTLGLSSRSYFSKIFKSKYKVSPKHYQQLQKETKADGSIYLATA